MSASRIAAPLAVAEAREHAGLRDRARPPARAVEADDLGVEAAVVVERAHEVDIGDAEVGRGQPGVDHRHLLGDLAVVVEPAELARQAHHARAHRRLVGLSREREETVARWLVRGDGAQRFLDLRRLALLGGQLAFQGFDPVEEQSHFGGVARQHVLRERELLGGAPALVSEAADILAMRRERIARADAAGDRE